ARTSGAVRSGTKEIEMWAKEIMSRPVVTCRPGDTLNEAARLMWEHDCGALPVVDDADRIVGMITDRDICMAAYTQGAPLWALPVERSMAHKVYSCHPDTPIEEAAVSMRAQRIRRLPVVDGDEQLVGMVTLGDLARHAGRSAWNGDRGGVAYTLATICEPTASALEARAGDEPMEIPPAAAGAREAPRAVPG
ncbi:MAG TPA: CBS domain-containing protein, partial [Myxococcales bacterium LLY-WYZ-16_1]|nr:CBS domain-containing protein [Myxococcales bacterium LLY-WYZ-16_1]